MIDQMKRSVNDLTFGALTVANVMPAKTNKCGGGSVQQTNKLCRQRTYNLSDNAIPPPAPAPPRLSTDAVMGNNVDSIISFNLAKSAEKYEAVNEKLKEFAG